MKMIKGKLKNVAISILPIIVFVLLYFVIFNIMDWNLFTKFLFSSILLIIGLTSFFIGIELSLLPFAKITGQTIAKKNKLWFLILFGFLLGFVIAIAEPALIVLCESIHLASFGAINSTALIFITSFGLAVFTIIGILRILYNLSIKYILLIIFSISFILFIFVNPVFLNIGFDISGAISGIISIPFILALGRGITLIKKDSKTAKSDSFGLSAIFSYGVVMFVLIYGGFVTINKLGVIPDSLNSSIFLISLKDTLLGFVPLIMMFIVLNIFFFKFKKREFKKFSIGFLYAFIGLFLFLFSVRYGFMDIAFMIGEHVSNYNLFIILFVSFIIGIVTILAEPSVYILTTQIKEVTGGYVSKKSILIGISIGVGIAISLSALRMIYPFLKLWYFIIPGYTIALILNFFIPKLFIGMSFDSGAVATGPLVATFILAFINGIASKHSISLLESFGMISLVGLFPILILQIIGLIYKIKSRKELLNERI